MKSAKRARRAANRAGKAAALTTRSVALLLVSLGPPKGETRKPKLIIDRDILAVYNGDRRKTRKPVRTKYAQARWSYSDECKFLGADKD